MFGADWSRTVSLVSEKESMVEIPARQDRPARQKLQHFAAAISILILPSGQRGQTLGTGQSADPELAYKDADADSLKRASFLIGIGTYLYRGDQGCHGVQIGTCRRQTQSLGCERN